MINYATVAVVLVVEVVELILVVVVVLYEEVEVAITEFHTTTCQSVFQQDFLRSNFLVLKVMLQNPYPTTILIYAK